MEIDHNEICYAKKIRKLLYWERERVAHKQIDNIANWLCLPAYK